LRRMRLQLHRRHRVGGREILRETRRQRVRERARNGCVVRLSRFHERAVRDGPITETEDGRREGNREKARDREVAKELEHAALADTLSRLGRLRKEKQTETRNMNLTLLSNCRATQITVRTIAVGVQRDAIRGAMRPQL